VLLTTVESQTRSRTALGYRIDCDVRYVTLQASKIVECMHQESHEGVCGLSGNSQDLAFAAAS
jgi:hypothetical protein